MTMFSMKPKFDLAEFLATPASAGVTRSRNAKRRKMLAQPAEEAEDIREPASAEDAPPTDSPEE